MKSSIWFILREPGTVPELKRTFAGNEKAFLIEAMTGRPTAFITVLSISEDGEPMVEDGPQYLEIMDGRQKGRARRHRASTKAAFAALR